MKNWNTVISRVLRMHKRFISMPNVVALQSTSPGQVSARPQPTPRSRFSIISRKMNRNRRKVVISRVFWRTNDGGSLKVPFGLNRLVLSVLVRPEFSLHFYDLTDACRKIRLTSVVVRVRPEIAPHLSEWPDGRPLCATIRPNLLNVSAIARDR